MDPNSITLHTLCERVEFLFECFSGPVVRDEIVASFLNESPESESVPVGTPLDPYDRAAQRRQRLGRIYREPGAFPSSDVVKVCTVSLQGRVQLVEERIVDDAYHRFFLVQEADGDARKGEAVHEVGSSVCERDLTRCLRLELWTDQNTDRIDAKSGGIC